MKRLIVIAAGLFLSASLIVPANAAPANTSNNPKQQGIKNAKKAMQSKLERDKKMREVQKKGQASRRMAQSGK